MNFQNTVLKVKQPTEMEMQRVKMLDDHIVVLRNLMDMISRELSQALEERQHLLEILGVPNPKETGQLKGSSDGWRP